MRPPPRSPLFPSATLFRSTATDVHDRDGAVLDRVALLRPRNLDRLPDRSTHSAGNRRSDRVAGDAIAAPIPCTVRAPIRKPIDRKSTRLNSSHDQISYAVF